jgi:hypothetical protein
MVPKQFAMFSSLYRYWRKSVNYLNFYFSTGTAFLIISSVPNNITLHFTIFLDISKKVCVHIYLKYPSKI